MCVNKSTDPSTGSRISRFFILRSGYRWLKVADMLEMLYQTTDRHYVSVYDDAVLSCTACQYEVCLIKFDKSDV